MYRGRGVSARRRASGPGYAGPTSLWFEWLGCAPGFAGLGFVGFRVCVPHLVVAHAVVEDACQAGQEAHVDDRLVRRPLGHLRLLQRTLINT